MSAATRGSGYLKLIFEVKSIQSPYRYARYIGEYGGLLVAMVESKKNDMKSLDGPSYRDNLLGSG